MTANPFLTGVFCHRTPTLEQDLFESNRAFPCGPFQYHVRLQQNTRNFAVHGRRGIHGMFSNPNTEVGGSAFGKRNQSVHTFQAGMPELYGAISLSN